MKKTTFYNHRRRERHVVSNENEPIASSSAADRDSGDDEKSIPDTDTLFSLRVCESVSQHGLKLNAADGLLKAFQVSYGETLHEAGLYPP